MAFSKVEITFLGIPAIDAVLIITNSLALPIIEQFVITRGLNNETTRGTDTDTQASFYNDAVELDHNSTNLYTIVLVGSVVTITSNLDGVVFVEDTNTAPGEIDVVITNEAATPVLTIDTVAFSEADTDPCNNIKVTVTTSELATKVTSPVLIDPNVANPYSFDFIRAVTISNECETATLNAIQSTQLPAILSVGSTTLTLFNTPTGANLTVTHTDTFGLTLTYSLDDIDFSNTTGVFNGLTPGNYIVYVKDTFGCKIQKDFVVSIFTPDISVTVPFFERSKSMSIRMKRDITWGNCADYKIEENTLSCESEVDLPYQTIQLFQTCDLIADQFKTNYETLAANVIKSDGTKDALSIAKFTNNLDKKDKRDAIYYDINGTQTGIYFITGNTYDFDTGLQNGTYELNGLLPEWGVIGNFIFLDTIGWLTIVDIIFNDDADADVLVVDLATTVVPTPIIVSSNYNLTNFEVYQFNTDMSVYDDQIIQVEILATSAISGFDDIRELSELLEIAVRWNRTMAIDYWNFENTDVFYATGIKNRIRIGYESFYPGVTGDVEGHNTDNSSILIKSKFYEINTLVIALVAVAIARQLTQAFGHSELFLNGAQYRVNDIPEIESHGNTNLQTISTIFTKSGRAFASDLEGDAPELNPSTEGVGLLKNEGKYIKLH